MRKTKFRITFDDGETKTVTLEPINIRKYRIDIKGNIDLIEGSIAGKYDLLTNEKGNKIEVLNTDILPELIKIKKRETNPYHGELTLRMVLRDFKSQKDLFKIFLFCSNVSKVEWSLYKIKIDNTHKICLGTYNCFTLSPGGSEFELSQYVSGVHSHPDIKNSTKDEMGSMYGDRGYTYKDILKYGKSPYIKYVYFPNSKRLWNINNKTSYAEFIKKVFSYNDLIFGTLNIK